MGKKPKSNQPSGKKPCNTSIRISDRPVTKNPGHIKNRLKRSEMYGRYLLEKKVQKRQKRLQRTKIAAELGQEDEISNGNPSLPIPSSKTRTLESTREMEITTVHPEDEEVLADEAMDEFAAYFADETRPKIIVTTRPRPSSELFYFIHDLMRLIPQTFFYPRKSFSVKEICEYAMKKDFTHLIVLSEKQKVCNGMIISHLKPTTAAPMGGPTAFFRVSHVIPSSKVPHHGSATNHIPELILNGFGTRLGHRVGRFVGSIFPHNAQFRGRQVVTFHNQRDYIFVRHHRYIFEEGQEQQKVIVTDNGKDEENEDDKEEEEEDSDEDEDNDDEDNEEDEVKAVTKKTKKEPVVKLVNKTKARLQELGPRFTLKLKWIQEGTFDTHFGEYEWIHKRKEMDTTRRKFHL